MNTILLAAATYLVTGIALTGYDFSAPPLHAKMYVIRRDHGEALRNWFAWPLSTAFEVFQLAALRRGPLRHLLGVLLLAAGIMVVLRFVFLISALVLPWEILGYFLAPLAAVGVSPMLTGLVMPAYGQPRASERAPFIPASGGDDTIARPASGTHSSRPLLENIRSQSEVLWTQLPEWVDIPDVPALKQMNALLTDHWRGYCHAYLYALLAAAEAKKDRHFLGSEREKVITVGVAQMMLDALYALTRRHSLPEPNRKNALDSASLDLAEAKAAMRSFIAALAGNQELPDKALIDYFAGKIGVPPQRREVFDGKLRTFTRATLIAFSSSTA